MGGPAVQRPAKWVKYLFRMGWDITVVTASDYPYHHSEDPVLEKEIRGCAEVIRIPFTTSANLVSRVAYRFGLKGFARLVMDDFLDFPDHMRHWCRKAEPIVESMIKKKFDALITTCLPASLNLLGARIRSRFCLPWFADFRDELAELPGHTKTKSRRLRRIEALTAGTADGLIFAHPGVARYFGERYAVPHQKMLELPNGFDPEDFSDLGAHISKPSSESTEMLIRHVGSFHASNSGIELCRGLGIIARQNGPSLKAKIQFVGGGPLCTLPEEGAVTCETLTRLPHTDAVRMLGSSDALLLYADSRRGKSFIPGKLFEYLAARRPIIAVAPPGSDVNEYVRRYAAGWYADASNPSDIARTLERAVKECSDMQRELNRNHRDIGIFSRARQAEILNDFIRGRLGQSCAC